MDKTLHARIAEAIGWTLKDVHSLSLSGLREMVRVKHRDLYDEIDRVLRSGSHIYGDPL